MKMAQNYNINDLKGEIWKDVPNYEGLYQVSNMGRVKSLNYHSTKKAKILKQSTDKKNYKRIVLSKKGVTHREFVHRLVYRTFIGELPKFKYGRGDETLVINHKDENPANNATYNLELITSTENNNYGNRGIKISNTKSYTVYQYSLNGEFIQKWKSTQECDNNGFCSSKVSLCCRGEKPTYKKYIWSYKKLNKNEIEKKVAHAKYILNKHQVKPVYQYTLDGIFIKKWESQHSTEQKGFCQGRVSACCNGLSKKHKGYLWSFEPIINNSTNK